MQTKTLSERIEELNRLYKIKKSYEFEPTNNEFFKAIQTLQELNAISYDANARLSKENEALLAKNKELEAKVEIANIALRQIKNLNPELPDDTRAFDNGYSVFRIAEATLEQLNKQGD